MVRKIVGMNKKYGVLIVLLVLCQLSMSAQRGETGNWMMVFMTNKLNDKWSIHSEKQYRYYSASAFDLEQLLLRTGLNYHLTDQLWLTAGYAYIPSYDYASDQKFLEITERRIWQQVLKTHFFGKIKFEHRFRLEQRWVNNDYRNRTRYRLMLFYPLNSEKIEKGSLFVGLYNEIFLNTTKQAFDRNRFYGALGYQLNKAVNGQLGLLHQQVGPVGKWYLQFSVFLLTRSIAMR